MCVNFDDSTHSNGDLASLLKTLPSSNDFQMIWYDDYWDGPISGLCSFRHEFYYYKITNMTTRCRSFLLFPLTLKDLEILLLAKTYKCTKVSSVRSIQQRRNL